MILDNALTWGVGLQRLSATRGPEPGSLLRFRATIPAMVENLKGLAAIAFLAFVAWFTWNLFFTDPPRPISDAICTDLRNGLTPFQIGMPGIRSGERTPRETVDWMHGHVLVGCPDQLDTNEELRSYLEAWEIDPDTR